MASNLARSLQGYMELSRQLSELGDPKAGIAALKASVKAPMDLVKKAALANIAKISPGETDLHRTYKGRLVSAGFAARNVVVQVRASRDKTSATAKLGVRREAFYAVQFFELGTARIRKQPWLVPAFEASLDESVRKVGEVLKARIQRIAAKRKVAYPGQDPTRVR